MALGDSEDASIGRLSALFTYEWFIKSMNITYASWEKNQNFFDYLIHGVGIRFSNFRLRHFGKVEAI